MRRISKYAVIVVFLIVITIIIALVIFLHKSRPITMQTEYKYYPQNTNQYKSCLNNSNKKLLFSDFHSLYVKDGDEWVYIEQEGTTNVTIMYVVLPRSSFTNTNYLSPFIIPLEEGEYRIDISYDKDEQKTTVSAYFEINNEKAYTNNEISS